MVPLFLRVLILGRARCSDGRWSPLWWMEELLDVLDVGDSGDCDSGRGFVDMLRVLLGSKRLLCR